MRRRSVRKRIQQRHQMELQEIVSRLLENPQADVAEGLRRLETYTQVLTFLQPRVSREALLSVLVAVLSIGIVGLLWSIRVAETRITLKVQSASLAFQLAQPWSWRGTLPLDSRLVTLEALTTVESPALFPRLASPQGDTWLHMTGGKAALVALHLAQHGIVEFDRKNDTALEIYTRSAPVSGQLTVRGAAHLKAGLSTTAVSLDTHTALEIPETISFSAGGTGAVPVKIRLHPQEPLVLQHVHVRELRFAREMPSEAGEITFVPTIISGTLTLHDVSNSVTLREGEPLTLTGIQGRLVQLRTESPFTLQFEGTAQQVRIGPPNAQGDLAPSLLRYYYHQEPLTFFWSAVVFVWGVLWSIRQTAFH